MSRYVRSILPTSPKAKPSAFIKQSYKRGIALIGTSSLVLGFGVSTSSPAYATPFSCVNDDTEDDNTAEPVLGDWAASRLAILDVLEDHSEICLDGNFVISGAIEFDKDIHVYGVGDSSIESAIGGVFLFDSLSGPANITIENLHIESTTEEAAVSGYNVEIKDSRFSDNDSGAVLAINQVVVINSEFVDNIGSGAITVTSSNPESLSVITGSTFIDNRVNTTVDVIASGGAVNAYAVIVTNSTFWGNSAVGEGAIGGAVAGYAVFALNSTFLGNKVEGTGAEGGAIFANTGFAQFSTFVDNEAPLPPGSGDVPGNAIYKSALFTPGDDGEPEVLLSLPFEVTANIFAGESEYPQLGVGATVDPADRFDDVGGNVFSNTTDIETDVLQHVSSKFGFSLSSIFGTSSPTLATFSPNSNGTQTIAISPIGPAVDVVPSQTFIDIKQYWADLNYEFVPEGLGIISLDFDQRGGTRSNPADAGAFEIASAPATLTPTASLAKTGNQNSWWLIVASATLLAFGSFATAVTSRLRRRSN